MTNEEIITLSKFLSKHLRHHPEALGLRLDDGGWVDVEALLYACAANGFPISRTQLNEVVATSDKQRFALDEMGRRIRANQGHSIAVNLQLPPIEPPAVLFHGTAAKNLSTILAEGLHRMRRHHVHLSADLATALKVGRRHGKPVVLRIDSAAMQLQGHFFYQSANGVWLTEQVPAQFIRIADENGW